MSDYSESIKLRYQQEPTEQLLFLYASTDLTEVATNLLLSELRNRGITDVDEKVKPIRAEIAEEREDINKAKREANKNADFFYRFIYIIAAVLVAGMSIYALIIGDVDKAIGITIAGLLAILLIWLKRLLWKFIIHLFTS